MTARLRRTGVLACTAAVERTVHGHLHEQIAFVGRRDKELAPLVEEVRPEEPPNFTFAEANLASGSKLTPVPSTIIALATDSPSPPPLAVTRSAQGRSPRRPEDVAEECSGPSLWFGAPLCPSARPVVWRDRGTHEGEGPMVRSSSHRSRCQ
ncbi:demethoxyubiquinone hydroxylase family protein [uncultured Phenylobacterium sp.]|uniref:demethoxyubiquinone hydroxylase family protein n=1 Tax=uncultured Phenylobacterium sp. TaxID=349273 RepID=UPI00345CD8A0